MSKRFKYKDYYLDTSGIIHNGNVLKDVLGVILYENSDGSNTNITLNDNVSNYEYIKIFYKNNDNVFNSVDVYIAKTNMAKVVALGAWTISSDVMYFKYKNITISENIISNTTALAEYPFIEYSMSTSGIIWLGQNNYIYITRVVGYK